MTATDVRAGESARELIARVMRDGRDVGPESPLVFRTEHCLPPGRLVAIASEGRALSACATLVREVVDGNRTLRVGLIGWVSTAPETRGRGLATRLLAAAEAELAREGCELALLWADDPAFYRKRGYAEVGSERLLAIDAAAEERLPRWEQTRALDPLRDAAATLALYRSHPVHCRRGLAEQSALLHTPRMRARVATRGGRAIAYACEGRGDDLQGVVHEWAGEVDAVLALQAELARDVRRRGEAAFAIAPASPHPVVEAWSRRGLEPATGVLGMARSLRDGDPARTFPPRSRNVVTAQSSKACPVDLFLWGLDSI